MPRQRTRTRLTRKRDAVIVSVTCTVDADPNHGPPANDDPAGNHTPDLPWSLDRQPRLDSDSWPQALGPKSSLS